MASWLLILMNLIVPGSGLIVLRREWLGCALSLIFGLTVEIALLGFLLLPRTISHGVATGTAIAAIGVWVLSQGLVYRRFRAVRGATAARQLRLLCEECERALSAGRLDEAQDLVLAARMVNDEDPAINRLWARTLTHLGRSEDATRAWRCVLQVESDPTERRVAARAIADLADRG